MTKCPKCGNTGRIWISCPDNKPGCAVAHFKICACKSPNHPLRKEMNEELE